MTRTAEPVRTFRVHARHVDVHHARTLREPSFEAAAIAYVEHLHDLPADGGEVSVVVRDLESGHEHSFRVDLGHGDLGSGDLGHGDPGQGDAAA